MRAKSAAASGRLHISKIGVNAPIVRVGVKNGALVLHPSTDVFSMWKDGVQPCARRGSVALVGHALAGTEGVGGRIDELSVGDRAQVNRCQYVVTSNRVFKNEQINKRQRASWYSFRGKSRGVIITCAGFQGYDTAGHAIYTHTRVVQVVKR